MRSATLCRVGLAVDDDEFLLYRFFQQLVFNFSFNLSSFSI